MGIGDEAFFECSSLTRIHFIGSREQWQALIKDIDIGVDTNNVEVTFGR